MATWREKAKRAIAASMAETAALPPEERIAAANAAYPFGPREMHPYKIWLSEMAALRKALLGPKPDCGACGAKGDEPCRVMAGEIEIGGRHFARGEKVPRG